MKKSNTTLLQSPYRHYNTCQKDNKNFFLFYFCFKESSIFTVKCAVQIWLRPGVALSSGFLWIAICHQMAPRNLQGFPIWRTFLGGIHRKSDDSATISRVAVRSVPHFFITFWVTYRFQKPQCVLYTLKDSKGLKPGLIRVI